MAPDEILTEDEMFNYLEECVHQGEVRVVFQKVDGTKRIMLCTLLESYYPNHVFSTTNDFDIPSDIMRVWDIEADAWRSIRKGSIEEVELVKLIPAMKDVG